MTLTHPMLSLTLILAVASAGRAEDLTFTKTRFSSVAHSKEASVNLSLTDSKILIAVKKPNKNSTWTDIKIPYSSIESMSYELASRHRLSEGAALMALSLGAGAIVMATKTKSHWLAIQHHEGDSAQLTVLRLDKSEYTNVIVALEAKSSKPIAMLDSKHSPMNPTSESKNVNELIPYRREAVASALKSAMETDGCKVTEEKEASIQCKRSRGGNERIGFGGEKITATVEPNGDQTRVRIWTGKGVVGRVGKKNWSTSIYEEMLKNLRGTTLGTSGAGE